MKKTTSFPRMSLGSALKTMEAAFNFGKAWTREEFASYGSKKASSAKSGAFANRIAALRSYGLINSTKDTIIATELAEQLVRPVDDFERKSALKKAYLNVDIFRKIYEESAHGVELPKTSIHSVAVTRYGIARDPRTISSFIASFVHSGITSGLITAVGIDKLVFNDNNDTNDTLSDETTSIQEEPQVPVDHLGTTDTTAVVLRTPSTLDITGINKNSVSVQGVEHKGKNWHLIVSFSSSLTIKSNMRAKIRDLIASADEVADVFYDLEEEVTM